MTIRGLVAAALLALALGGVSRAEEWRAALALEGALAPAIVDEAQETESLLAFGRLRLTTRISRGRGLTFEIGHEVNALAGRQSLLLLGPSRTSTLRLWDLDPELHTGQDLVVGHNLDRLNAALRLGDAVVTVGRQAISHGSGRFFNPTDFASPMNPYAAFTEYRIGVDALRVSKPFGERLEMEAYAVGHEDSLREGLLLGRARILATGFDLSLLAGSAFGHPSCALDVSGDWGGAGWYGEAAARLGGGRRSALARHGRPQLPLSGGRDAHRRGVPERSRRDAEG